MMKNEKPETYLGNPNLKKVNVDIPYTEEQLEEYVKCAKDPIYFIENYMKIITLDKGLAPFVPWDFQKELLETVHNNRFVICKYPRQTGKSTTVIGYMLHYVLFTPEVNVAILANKLATARELLHRLKTGYEQLPKWLQQGVVEWNKGSIFLENGSKIIASATSSSAVRGGSFNMIFLDEFAYVPQGVAEEFFSSVYPTISSGKSTKVLIVSTPNGLNMFYKLWTDAQEGRNEYVPVEVHWSQVPGRDDKWKKQTIANTSAEQFKVEFECDFIGSQNTLIDSSKLKSLAFKTPIYKTNDGLKLYKKPEKGHTYMITVDVSHGKGMDYHAFSIIDMTSPPYEVVGTFRNNDLSPLLYPNIINSVGKQYNDAFILIELNDIGHQVSYIMHNEFEYDNLLTISIRGRKGQTLDAGFGSVTDVQRGLKTTKATKRVGCSMLKSMIEEDKLVVTDYDTIQEFASFVAKRNSYEADHGQTDDMVMTLVMFGWITSQPYFKDLMNVDLRNNMYKDRMVKLEEEVVPFGIIDTGDDSEVGERDNDGDVWFNAKEEDESSGSWFSW